MQWHDAHIDKLPEWEMVCVIYQQECSTYNGYLGMGKDFSLYHTITSEMAVYWIELPIQVAYDLSKEDE